MFTRLAENGGRAEMVKLGATATDTLPLPAWSSSDLLFSVRASLVTNYFIIADICICWKDSLFL